MTNAKDTTPQRSLLLKWYRKHARDLPWRTTTTTPYEVLVSETMLQQTQASRIAELLPVFLQTYPTVHELAAASNAQILRSWKGLGYNSRALRLRDAARLIVGRHNGVVPQALVELQALPGVGPYTSSAVACFAYQQNVVVVDVNVRRVYSRWMTRRLTTIDVASETEVRVFALTIIPTSKPDDWHHAVMDLGSTICTARTPSCSSCPIAEVCPSNGTMQHVNRARRKEPHIRGEPRRIWRGRIVETLRNHPNGLMKKALVQQVFTETDDEEDALIEDVFVRLEQDNIVSIRGRRIQLAID